MTFNLTTIILRTRILGQLCDVRVQHNYAFWFPHQSFTRAPSTSRKSEGGSFANFDHGCCRDPLERARPAHAKIALRATLALLFGARWLCMRHISERRILRTGGTAAQLRP